MTWVLGWPLYEEDALEIAKKHNLAPKTSDARRIQAAVMWVANQVGIIRALACWVHDRPESVFVAYVDYGDNRYPPTKLARSELLTQKQFRCLKQAMPLKNFGWYQHNDPSSTLYGEIRLYASLSNATHCSYLSEITTHEYDDDVEEEEEDSEEDSDTSDDESSDEDSGDEQSMDAANDSDGGDATESDNETVTDGV
ncbi:uncharacterized protein C8Q71DRAFT_744149 [Rhodofomes roseus]|uniref:Uncharacterized protein n=1 Tax=Rhodofomes roseus TaxID=34475 RepID=A0ABQ8KMW9_9APHY|nr:uncharacterized protein C8Q71DRAFT_744149 [Rhodofomes roseus]KAH9839764.1 hypothetical protein C8Q71DRAFT_744149 [Rhodofomes roseus]